MFIMRFIHSEETLYVGKKKYKATCPVRNELNGWRKDTETVGTMPETGHPAPYYPRKFPTGVWRVGKPEWTAAPEFAPVKIPTDAKRNVFTWTVRGGRYVQEEGVQEDSAYHIHYSNSRTTLGCIRLDSLGDAVEIAHIIESEQQDGPVYIEVIASR